MTIETVETPAAQSASTFRVVADLSQLIAACVESHYKADSESANALHAFLAATAEADSQLVYATLDEKAKASKSNKSRVSEIKAVFTATIHGMPDADVMGYQVAVKAARAYLKEKGIMPNGNPRKSDEERAGDAERRFLKRAISDLMDEGLGAKEAGERAEAAWAVEQQRREGVAQETIDEIAIDFVDNLIGDGLDYKSIRRVCSKVLELVKQAEADKKLAEDAAKSQTM